MQSFIPWVGGKRSLAGRIVSLIPRHEVYAEPFMGAAWVFFAKPRSQVEVLNDLNGDLVNLFRVIRDRFQDFYLRRIFLISAEREYKDFVRRLKTMDWQDDVERALMFWYCLKQSFGAQVGGGWGFARTRPPESLDMDGLKEIHERLKGVYINDQAALECIRRWDSPATFFYLDPPYMITTTAKGRGYYQHTMTLDDHSRLREALGKIKGRWLLSYDDDPLIRKLYEGFTIMEPEVTYTLNNRPGIRRRRVSELLIANYELPRPSLGR